MNFTISKNWSIALTFILSLGLVVGGFMWSYIALSDTQTEIILHFVHGEGINQRGTVGNLIIPAVFGAIMLAINFLLVSVLIKTDKALGGVLSIAGVYLSVLIFISFAVIISVN